MQALLRVILLGCVGAGLVHGADGKNVVVILVDDLGYMDIGANNPGTFYETPNVDALAARR